MSPFWGLGFGEKGNRWESCTNSSLYLGSRSRYITGIYSILGRWPMWWSMSQETCLLLYRNNCSSLRVIGSTCRETRFKTIVYKPFYPFFGEKGFLFVRWFPSARFSRYSNQKSGMWKIISHYSRRRIGTVSVPAIFKICNYKYLKVQEEKELLWKRE